MLLQMQAAVELDADSLERILNLVSDSGLLRATHTARLVSGSWSQAVNSRAHRLREVTNSGESADLSALLYKTPHLTALEVAFSSITSTACRQLHRLQLQELTLADCSSLEAKDLHCLHELTGLRVLKLSNTKAAASAALANCSNLLNLHTLELRGFKALNEKLFTQLTPLTNLKTLSLVPEEASNATLGALCMQLLSWCAPHLTYLECGKVESTYPLAALRELSELQVLSLTNCKPFLKPDDTGHDLLVEVAHLTQLSSLLLRQFATHTLHSAELHQDMRQLKGLKCLHVEQGRARGFIEGLTALTGLKELVLLDELTQVQSRHVLNEILLSLIYLTKLELSVTGDVLVEGFRLFRHLPYLKHLKFEGCHSFDTKGLSNLFWGLTGLTGSLSSLSLKGSQFGAAIQGKYRTAAGASVHELDLGEFPLHSLQIFANVFPKATSLHLTLRCLQELPLKAWVNLTSIHIHWLPQKLMNRAGSPTAMCTSLAQLPSLRQLVIECVGKDMCLERSDAPGLRSRPFALLAGTHADLLKILPGVDLIIVCPDQDGFVLSS